MSDEGDRVFCEGEHARVEARGICWFDGQGGLLRVEPILDRQAHASGFAETPNDAICSSVYER